jgi:hypothetical protein
VISGAPIKPLLLEWGFFGENGEVKKEIQNLLNVGW